MTSSFVASFSFDMPIYAYTACLQLPALRVLLYSIRRTETRHPITVLALPGVTAGAVDEIQMLGHQVLPVPQLDYPYEGLVKYEAGINKQCRYSKLHLWNLALQYSKVLYLDVDTAVQKVCHSRVFIALTKRVHVYHRTSIICSV